MKQKGQMEVAKTKAPKRRHGKLTQARQKRILIFKLISSTDSNKYGRVGTPKWGDELHKHLADKRITRADIQHWIDTKREIAEPLAETRKHESRVNTTAPRYLRSQAESPVVVAETPRSRSSSADSCATVVRPVADSNGNHGTSGDENPSGSTTDFSNTPSPNGSVHEHDTRATAPTSSQRTCTTPTPAYQQRLHLQDISSDTTILEDMSIGFAVVQKLSQLSTKYEKLRRLGFDARVVYSKLEKFHKTNIVPQLPQQWKREVEVYEEITIIPDILPFANESFETVEIQEDVNPLNLSSQNPSSTDGLE